MARPCSSMVVLYITLPPRPCLSVSCTTWHELTVDQGDQLVSSNIRDQAPISLTASQPYGRSMLFVPVTSIRFVERAHARGADAIILDLEDGVAASGACQ